MREERESSLRARRAELEKLMKQTELEQRELLTEKERNEVATLSERETRHLARVEENLAEAMQTDRATLEKLKREVDEIAAKRNKRELKSQVTSTLQHTPLTS